LSFVGFAIVVASDYPKIEFSAEAFDHIDERPHSAAAFIARQIKIAKNQNLRLIFLNHRFPEFPNTRDIRSAVKLNLNICDD